MNFSRNHILLAIIAFVGLFSVFYFLIPAVFSVAYSPGEAARLAGVNSKNALAVALLTPKNTTPEVLAAHVKTPEAVKAIYMSACVAGTPSWRTKMMELIDTTELNAVVIDVKDFSGTISYYPTNPKLLEATGLGCRVKDMAKYLEQLHAKNIYIIGRITVFQDPYYTKQHPELAVKRASDGGVWRDRKRLSFIDVSAKPYWEYIAELARDSYALGFDEINFDYIRFPSDGNMKDIAFPWTGTMAKATALEHFFVYLEQEVKPSGAVISADLFGMTTTNTDDLNIGQVLEPALAHFDYVAPMVYPSHYPANFNGWKNPNNYPYELIKFVMSRGATRAEAVSTSVLTLGAERIGTTTPALYKKAPYNKNKLRPWLQDFDYGGNYGPAEVRAQIKGTYDAGLNSWMLWDPNNRYTPEALEKV